MHQVNWIRELYSSLLKLCIWSSVWSREIRGRAYEPGGWGAAVGPEECWQLAADYQEQQAWLPSCSEPTSQCLQHCSMLLAVALLLTWSL